MDTYFAVTAPGLEVFTAKELQRLFPDPSAALRQAQGSGPGQDFEPDPAKSGRLSPNPSPAKIQPSPFIPQPLPGGVAFTGGLPELYRANLHLRTASRVLARLGSSFYAAAFSELRKKASRLPWERFLTPGQPVSIRATCHKSKLYHSEAVAERVAGAIADRLGKSSPLLKPADEESASPPQLVVVRLVNDLCTVSIDSSGELLHRRGYRQAVAKAPLRETLAAAMLIASGWDLTSPLLDPFCGSGTIPIEAALMARGIPPGGRRKFAFMEWPGFEQSAFSSQLSASTYPLPLTTYPLILASDRDAGAIEMARANAERAGVAEMIEFTRQAVSSVTPPAATKGWVVTNPPYGKRVSEGKDIRNLYAQFGNVLRQKCPGWEVSVLCSDPSLLGQLHLTLDTSLALVNGGVNVRLGRGVVNPKNTKAERLESLRLHQKTMFEQYGELPPSTEDIERMRQERDGEQWR
jgi:putative N6-adenine-specific DNA methylase